MDQKKLTLYTYFRSSTSWRVRIVLNLKEIPVDFKFIHLAKHEQRSEEYRKINPNGGVPALLLPTGDILIESMAICEYLEETHPEKPVLPKDPILKAKIRGFCEVINSGMHPYQNLIMLEKVEKDFQANKMEFAHYWVARGFDTLQSLLQKTMGKYCFGDQITLADAFFYPQVLSGVNRFGMDVANFPRIKAVLTNLQSLEAFQKAEPKNQPDFQK